jgi:hypothetical protein
MIVCKKPCTLYDVDVLGAAGVLVLTLAAWWLVVAPWQHMWRDYQALSAARVVATTQLCDDVKELERFEQGLTQLDELVTADFGDIPRSDSVSQLLRKITALAEGEKLELLNVTPQPATPSGAYLVSDIKVGARGHSRDFIRFLDRLARENPYQSLLTCSINRAAQTAPGICEFDWTVRAYLLPPAKNARGGSS